MEIHIEHIQSMSPGFFEDMKKFHQEIAGTRGIKCEIPDYKNNRQAIERGLKKCRRNGDIDNKITAMRLI